MRFISKFISWSATILLGIILLLKCSGNGHIFKALRSTYMVGKTAPTIEDQLIFDNRIIKPGRQRPLKFSNAYGSYEVDKKTWRDIESYDPIGFLVVLNEDVIIEKYWDDYDDASLTNSFSVAKSIVALTMLKAVELGYVKSIDQKVIDFIPELDGKYNEDVTIRHLLQMTSGIDFNESYGNPFGFMAAAYYGDDLEDLTLDYDADIEPGSQWEYLGGNTILMAIIIKRATGVSMGAFFQDELWQQLGAPFPALWSLDHEQGMEKAYCCFYTSLRDFARIGMVLTRNGSVFLQNRLDGQLVREIKKPVVLNNGDTVQHYGLQWWKINYEGADITYARGIYGQYIISIPAWDMVVVRLGKRRGPVDENKHPEDLYHYLKVAKSLYDQASVNK